MFWDNSLFAREHAQNIARMVAKELKPEAQTLALDWLDAVFKKWLLEQGDEKGFVEIPLMNLGDIGQGKTARRVAVDEVAPFQAGGWGVQSNTDLFRKLWLDGNTDIAQVIGKLGLGVPIALLLNRDAKEMPMDSIMWALEILFDHVKVGERVALEMLGAAGRRRAGEQVKRKEASKLGADKAKRKGEMRRQHYTRSARAIYEGWLSQGRANVSYRDLAKAVHEELLGTVDRLGSVRTIKDHLERERVKDATHTELTRKARSTYP